MSYGNQITEVQYTKFLDQITAASQQRLSRTAPYLNFKMLDAEDMAIDDIGRLTSQEIQGRNEDLTFSEQKWGRRQLTRQRWGVAVELDGWDIDGMLSDPESPLIEACVAELNRRKDRIIMQAAFADVKTGRNFGTTVTYANDNGLTVDATGGLVYDTLLEIRQNFEKRDVMCSKIAYCLSDVEKRKLMKETQLISGDFTSAVPVDSGQMAKAVGIDLVLFGSEPINDQPILPVASSTRDGLVIGVRDDGISGMCMGLSRDIEIDIVKARETKWDTTIIKAMMTVGAVRRLGELVQKVQTTE